MASPVPNRREFLKATACFGALAVSGSALAQLTRIAPLAAGTQAAATGPLVELIRAAPTARFWVSTTTASTEKDCRVCHSGGDLPADLTFKHATKTVQCGLCARNCRIEEGDRGMCQARLNVDGELKSLVYGRPISVHVDPIEKKPFYNFLPGSAAFSMATSGCPLRCKFCQNWEISQARPEDYSSETVSPQQIARAAVSRKAPVIAFTYNEPTVFTEYLLDIAAAGKLKGRRSVLVSCGFMNEAPLAAMCEALDAIKIDLKGFSEDFYHNVCGAELKPVLRSIKQVAASGTHLEIVNLVVPTLNDSPEMLTELSKWVAGEVGPDVPVHFTRFHPDYQLRNLSPTPVTTLERARDIALKAGLHYPYVGNVPGHPGNNTYCPKCKKPVIERTGFFVTDVHLQGHGCAECGTAIAGVWD